MESSAYVLLTDFEYEFNIWYREKKAVWYLKCSIWSGYTSYMDYIWSTPKYSYLFTLDKISTQKGSPLVTQTDLGRCKMISSFDVIIDSNLLVLTVGHKHFMIKYYFSGEIILIIYCFSVYTKLLTVAT